MERGTEMQLCGMLRKSKDVEGLYEFTEDYNGERVRYVGRTTEGILVL